MQLQEGLEMDFSSFPLSVTMRLKNASPSGRKSAYETTYPPPWTGFDR